MLTRPYIRLFTSGSKTPNDFNFANLAEFYGISVLSHDLQLEGLSFGQRDRINGSEKICYAASADTLRAVITHSDLAKELSFVLFSNPCYLLVYGFAPEQDQAPLVEWLSGGRMNLVCGEEIANANYKISSSYRTVCGQMSGISFGPIDPDNDSTFFKAVKSASVTDLISIAGRPFFAWIKQHECDLFFVAGRHIADIDGAWYASDPLEKCFPRLVPYIMFFRHVFADSIWHSETAQASLIVDDPLIKRTYGFLDYQELLNQMIKRSFFTNIAFIPFNYKRTNSETAELILKHPDYYALCVHGCDHTKGEFGISDIGQLDELVKRATQRMNSHASRTGLRHQEVMVFPQGVFSSESFRVLKWNNYLAAISTDAAPINKDSILTIADYLAPAVVAYGDFPLFLRRNPGNIAGLAFDLLLGKPALVVIHHSQFRRGYKDFGDFVEHINSLDPGLHWRSLQQIALHAHLQRREAADRIEVRAYTRTIEIENPSDKEITYWINKKETFYSDIATVSANEKPIPYHNTGGWLSFNKTLGPSCSTHLEINYQNRFYARVKSQSSWSKLRVRARRYLSEYRDDYFWRIPFVESLWKTGRRALFSKGQTPRSGSS